MPIPLLAPTTPPPRMEVDPPLALFFPPGFSPLKLPQDGPFESGGDSRVGGSWWVPALFESGAVNLTLPHKVIIDTWQTAGWQQAAVAGYNVVASREPRLYLDYPEHSAAAMWYDLLNGSSNPKLVSRLLGAEVSMWSDRYVPRVSSSLLVQLLQ